MLLKELYSLHLPGPGLSSTSPDIRSKVPMKLEATDEVDSSIVITTLRLMSTIVLLLKTFLPLMKVNLPLVFFHSKLGTLRQSSKHKTTNNEFYHISGIIVHTHGTSKTHQEDQITASEGRRCSVSSSWSLLDLGSTLCVVVLIWRILI